MKEIEKLGSITSFIINFHLYIAKKPWAEMWWLWQSSQIILNTSIWQGILTYHTFLMVRWQ